MEAHTPCWAVGLMPTTPCTSKTSWSTKSSVPLFVNVFFWGGVYPFLLSTLLKNYVHYDTWTTYTFIYHAISYVEHHACGLGSRSTRRMRRLYLLVLTHKKNKSGGKVQKKSYHFASVFCAFGCFFSTKHETASTPTL